jgi:hypothetical protein
VPLATAAWQAACSPAGSASQSAATLMHTGVVQNVSSVHGYKAQAQAAVSSLLYVQVFEPTAHAAI